MRILLLLSSVIFGVFMSSCTTTDASSNTADSTLETELQISGQVVNGYRVLKLDTTDEDLHFTVYRGDYLKFALLNYESTNTELTLRIPTLNFETVLSETIDEKQFFKMKVAGEYDFTLGNKAGIINVIELREANYRELSSQEAATLIQDISPLIVDVRTPGEYARGHLENSVLIPLQQFQNRVGELEKYKNQPILLYCASGNRSTVASKILLNMKYKNVINLRYGIKGWKKDSLPVVH